MKAALYLAIIGDDEWTFFELANEQPAHAVVLS